MRTKKLNNKGFTLVEVIVVAVIVAVLALVAIQLYTGYVSEARRNTAENMGASAAGYIQSAINAIGEDAAETACTSPLTDGESWTVTLDGTGGTNTVTFTAPANCTLTVDATNDNVTAKVGDQSSVAYQYK